MPGAQPFYFTHCTNVGFIKWLIDKKGFKIKKIIRMDGFLVDYNFSYHATEGNNSDNIWNITRQFKTTNGVIKNLEQFATTRTTTTTVVLRPFSLLTQGLAGGSTQQPPPPLPILHIFPFQPTLSHVASHYLAPCHPQPSPSNDMIFFTYLSSFHSTCPNHLNLFHFMASETDSIPILSLSEIPHIHTFQFHIP